MIKSLHLDHFKNFKNATLRLGPFTVLIGANASGKSNIRDAFRFLHGIGMHYRLAEILGEAYYGSARVWDGIRGGKREVAYSGSETFELGVGMEIPSRDDGAYHLDYRIGVLAGGSVTMPPRLVQEALNAGDRLVFRTVEGEAQDGKVSVALPLVEDKSGQHPRIMIFPSDAPVLAQAEDLISSLDKLQSASAVLKELRSLRFLDPSPLQIRNPSLPGHAILGDQGQNLSSVLAAICEDPAKKEVLLEWVRKLTPMDVDGLLFDQDAAGRILLRLVEKDGRSFSALSVSDGTLRFLAILAELFGPEPASLYFIEELENGIHPARLSLLVDLIEHQTKRRGIQIVATSHSPQLLQVLSEESLKSCSLVYRLPDHPDAKIKPILEIPNARRVIEEQPVWVLHASSWFEDVMNLTEDVGPQPMDGNQPVP